MSVRRGVDIVSDHHLVTAAVILKLRKAGSRKKGQQHLWKTLPARQKRQQTEESTKSLKKSPRYVAGKYRGIMDASITDKPGYSHKRQSKR